MSSSNIQCICMVPLLTLETLLFQGREVDRRTLFGVIQPWRQERCPYHNSERHASIASESPLPPPWNIPAQTQPDSGLPRVRSSFSSASTGSSQFSNGDLRSSLFEPMSKVGKEKVKDNMVSISPSGLRGIVGRNITIDGQHEFFHVLLSEKLTDQYHPEYAVGLFREASALQECLKFVIAMDRACALVWKSRVIIYRDVAPGSINNLRIPLLLTQTAIECCALANDGRAFCMVGTSGNAVRLFIYRSSDEPPTQNPNGSMSPWTQIYLPPISKTESWVTTAIRFFPNSNGGQKLAVASFPVETSSSRRKINYKIAFYQYLPESMSVHYSHNPVHIPLEDCNARVTIIAIDPTGRYVMVAADRAMAPYLIDLEATETMAKKIPCSIRTNILSCAVWERASHVALLTEAEVWVGMKSHSDRLGLNYSWKSKRLGSPFTAAQRRHQVSIAFLGNDFSENSGNSIVRGPNISTVVLDRKGGVKAYHFSFP